MSFGESFQKYQEQLRQMVTDTVNRVLQQTVDSTVKEILNGTNREAATQTGSDPLAGANQSSASSTRAQLASSTAIAAVTSAVGAQTDPSSGKGAAVPNTVVFPVTFTLPPRIYLQQDPTTGSMFVVSPNHSAPSTAYGTTSSGAWAFVSTHDVLPQVEVCAPEIGEIIAPRAWVVERVELVREPWFPVGSSKALMAAPQVQSLPYREKMYVSPLRSLLADTVWCPGARVEADFNSDLSPCFPAPSGKVTANGFTGIHAFKTMDQVHEYVLPWLGGAHFSGPHCPRGVVLGTVKLWGTVIEHETGYRAEFAKINTIDHVLLSGRTNIPGSLVLSELHRVYGVHESDETVKSPPTGQAGGS